MSPLDKITIEGLAAKVRIGIYDWEKKRAQTIRIDLAYWTDTREAARTDDIAATINYNDVAKAVLKLLKEQQFQLIETLADAIAKTCLEQFAIAKIAVTVHKPSAVRAAGDVTVTVERP